MTTFVSTLTKNVKGITDEMNLTLKYAVNDTFNNAMILGNKLFFIINYHNIS